MKIAKLSVKNFRGLQDIEVTFDENLNVLIGKNDIGKSSILEAMEIFFNNSTVKLDNEDLCKFTNDNFIEIGISFLLDNTLLTIDTIPTHFDDEFLLDSDGYLTIIKRWDCSKQTITKSSLQVFLKADYPKEISTPYILLKSAELKRIVHDTFGDKIPETVKLTTNSTMRLALYNIVDSFDREEILIPLDKEDAKKIWVNLEKDMPMFFLFQSDRANKDSDKEVQDPLKAITKLAIGEVQEKLDDIVASIENKVMQIGQNTIDKMKEMDSEIADSLKPDLSHKNWDSLFSFSFIGDNEIPINKRGSGFRRLLLLNYFRAEAERGGLGKPIIYAIEEPETALHPNWQMMLIKSLVELSDRPNIQVFLTTHSPSLASQVDHRYIRYIHKEKGNEVIVDEACESNFDEICNTLGIFPDSNVLTNDELKVVLCLEGINDVSFFFNISHLFNVDLRHSRNILLIPLGGSTLKDWVDRKLLDKLKIPQIHIYDNDVNSYQKSIDVINQRNDNSYGCVTNMKEIENYIHPSLVRVIYELDCDYYIDKENWRENWATHKCVLGIEDFLKKLNDNGYTIPSCGRSSIKSKLCNEGAQLMTKELFEDLGVYDEVENWFEIIKETANL